jgi:scytalone dehydratase
VIGKVAAFPGPGFATPTFSEQTRLEMDAIRKGSKDWYPTRADRVIRVILTQHSNMFDIYFPDNLDFRDYINVSQVARTWADGYDRKVESLTRRPVFASTDTHYQDKERLRASLASNVVVDYTGVVPSWGSKQYTASAFVDEWLSPAHLGLKSLATQHLLALHYFKSVSDLEIVVEWQQIASHGRRSEGEDFANPMCKIEAESNHRSYMQHTFVKENGRWRIAVIRPEILYQPGDFMEVRRPE